MRSQLDHYHFSMMTWLGAIAAAGETMPLRRPRPSASRRTKYDLEAALRYRLERKVRKAMEHRKRNRLPKVTTEEVLAWTEEEIAKAKEKSDDRTFRPF